MVELEEEENDCAQGCDQGDSDKPEMIHRKAKEVESTKYLCELQSSLQLQKRVKTSVIHLLSVQENLRGFQPATDLSANSNALPKLLSMRDRQNLRQALGSTTANPLRDIARTPWKLTGCKRACSWMAPSWALLVEAR